jgi:predicted nucleic acid-binding protein
MSVIVIKFYRGLKKMPMTITVSNESSLQKLKNFLGSKDESEAVEFAVEKVVKEFEQNQSVKNLPDEFWWFIRGRKFGWRRKHHSRFKGARGGKILMSFWDSSALVPLCTNEPRSISAGRLWKNLSQKFVWWETSVEISSALARLERENLISLHKRLSAEKRLEILEKVWTEIQPIPRIKELARTFPAQYKMKAADSLQLAAALVWCKENPKGKDFVSGDEHLIKVAKTIGFTIFLL